jgi:alkanesulfonate monooxygenase SsuD/methylene tetrahydromethanopterin reductase-like flavin-dependent oxidoreductase (luciferase family)
MVTTIDHMSGGRVIMGMGAAWFEAEHRAFELEFGTGFGERLDWLAETATATRTLLDGGVVSSPESGRLL